MPIIINTIRTRSSASDLCIRLFLAMAVVLTLLLAASSAGDYIWISKGLAGKQIYALAIDPMNPSTIYAGSYGGGVFKSVDGGDSWNAVNNGLTSTSIWSLAINPQNPSIVYAGSSQFSGGGVFRSVNGGASWNLTSSGLTSTNIYAIAINPQDPNIIYAGTSAGTSGGGVFKSVDGGGSWSNANNGLPNFGIKVLVIDPQTPGTLYAGTSGGGAFKSIDGGASWSAINNGLTNTTVSSLAFDPKTPSTVYAGTNYKIFKSVNGGANWSAIDNLQNQIQVVAIDPQDSATIYAGIFTSFAKSVNGGIGWYAVDDGLTNTDIKALAVDPRIPTALYVGTNGGGVFKLQPHLHEQSIAATLNAPTGTMWNNMALYRSGWRLFVSDLTNNRILVYNSSSLAYLGQISFASYAPAGLQRLAIHEGTGTLYVAVDTGMATSATTIVAINANTLAVRSILTGIGRALELTIDENRGRLYTSGKDDRLHYTVTAIDVTTNTVISNLDVGELMGLGIIVLGGLNPVTGELLYTNMHYDNFVVVNGPALTGQKISIAGSRGWDGTWNYLENKIYITTINWGGYFIYDRDTGASSVTGCINDGTYLFFSEATNRVYSSAEIDGNSTVIDGITNSCQNIKLGGGLTYVGFVKASRHAYFSRPGFVKMLDEDSLTVENWFNTPGVEGYGAVDGQVVVDQDKRRIFIRSTWGSPAQGSSLVIIDDGGASTCVAPLISVHPSNTTIDSGGVAALQITATGTGPLKYEWYEGAQGDTGRPVGTNSAQFTSPPVSNSTSYWVRVSNSCGQAESQAAVITVRVNPLSQTTLSLSGGGAVSTSTLRSAGELIAGYAVGTVGSGSAPYGTAVFSYRQNGVVVSEVGVPASPPTLAARFFVDTRTKVSQASGSGTVDIFTGFAAVNPNNAASILNLKLRNSDGVSLTQGIVRLAGGEHIAKFLDQLAPDFVLPPGFITNGLGSLEITSDQPVSILALRLTINQRGDLLLTSTPIADLAKPAPTAVLSFPQIADGDGYQTTLVLMNTASAVETGVVRFYDNNGSALPVRMAGAGAADTGFPYSIPSGGFLRLVTDGSPSNVNVGWAQLTPDAGMAAPVSAAIFSLSLTQSGTMVTESGVPAVTPTTHARIYVDKSGGHDTGLAMANPGSTSIRITANAYQLDGVTRAGSGQSTVDMDSMGHDARFAGQLIAGLPEGFTGVLDLSSPSPFTALTLRSLTNGRGDFLITTFPVADVNQPPPTPLIFPQVADGGGYQTQIILLSTSGAASTVTVSYLGNDGSSIAVGRGTSSAPGKIAPAIGKPVR